MNGDGVWWLVGPTGKREFLNTVTTVQPFQLGRERDGVEFISRDWTGGTSLDGDVESWAEKTLARVRDAGFKGLGAWCHPVFHKHNVPIARDLNLLAWMYSAGLKFYSPAWPEMAERAVRVQVEPLRDNVNLVGYYTDNEIDWGDPASGPAVHFDDLPPADPNRQAVMRTVRRVWTTLENFNADWKLSLADWSDIDAWKKLPHQPQEAYSRLYSAWLSQLAEDYFKLTTALVRKYDPNHLILGVRFKAYAPDEVVRASRNYTDVQSINYYAADAKLDQQMLAKMYELSGQPIILSEYSFHALDGRSGNRNTFGFAAQVLDQQARADAYRLFTTRAARVPYIVGADWFQWMDEPPSGRTADGEDVNFGIVDVDDRPYDLLVESIRKTTPQLNGLHAASHRDEQKDVWRERFDDKPTFNVPFLAAAPRLNGELSDWPAASKVPGLRHAQTVGLERSKLPVPNIYMGWNYEGLYIGMEVFDNDIQATPPNAWWWTRDSAEIWLSTRPVASDQNTYNQYSHQFFFVPIDVPFENHFLGCVGQWHRDGDALKDHLVPHPDVREAVRIRPDRYIVEMFLPAKSLNGFEPRTHRAMAMNLHVRNFQHATEYFWSAPKQVMTQLRPNTWGNIYLELPGERTADARRVPATQPTACVR